MGCVGLPLLAALMETARCGALRGALLEKQTYTVIELPPTNGAVRLRDCAIYFMLQSAMQAIVFAFVWLFSGLAACSTDKNFTLDDFDRHIGNFPLMVCPNLDGCDSHRFNHSTLVPYCCGDWRRDCHSDGVVARLILTALVTYISLNTQSFLLILSTIECGHCRNSAGTIQAVLKGVLQAIICTWFIGAAPSSIRSQVSSRLPLALKTQQREPNA